MNARRTSRRPSAQPPSPRARGAVVPGVRAAPGAPVVRAGAGRCAADRSGGFWGVKGFPGDGRYRRRTRRTRSRRPARVPGFRRSPGFRRGPGFAGGTWAGPPTRPHRSARGCPVSTLPTRRRRGAAVRRALRVAAVAAAAVGSSAAGPPRRPRRAPRRGPRAGPRAEAADPPGEEPAAEGRRGRDGQAPPGLGPPPGRPARRQADRQLRVRLSAPHQARAVPQPAGAGEDQRLRGPAGPGPDERRTVRHAADRPGADRGPDLPEPRQPAAARRRVRRGRRRPGHRRPGRGAVPAGVRRDRLRRPRPGRPRRGVRPRVRPRVRQRRALRRPAGRELRALPVRRSAVRGLELRPGPGPDVQRRAVRRGGRRRA